MSHEVREVAARPAAAFHIKQLEVKLATGAYRQEPVSCFCGSTDARQVTERDRYGLPYQMCLCRQCGLLYANPRLDAESTVRFYKDEYRKIYDDNLNLDERAERQRLSGQRLLSLLRDYFDWTPKVVLDIGCHEGRWLESFREAGVTCYGTEVDEPYPDVQPDLIILNHVVEHFRDLETELRRVRDLLPMNGRVYIGVPGLYSWDRKYLWQSAHNWQFTATTLRYVMECCGFEELWHDEIIQSIWEKSEVCRPKHRWPEGEFRRNDDFLNDRPCRAPVVHTFNKFPVKDRKVNLEAAFSQGCPDIVELENAYPDGKAVIIAGGPSIDSYIDQIRAQQAAGSAVFAIERMGQWCLTHGIEPENIVVMDASDDVPGTIETLPVGPRYLVAAQSHHGIWPFLRDRQVYVFNTPQRGLHPSYYWDKYGLNSVRVINAGGSVGLAAMSLAMTMGCRQLDIYGFDCHIRDSGYAHGIQGVGEQRSRLIVEVEGECLTTTAQYLSFAQQFFYLMEMARKNGMIRVLNVHGDSLVNRMAVKPWQEMIDGDCTAAGRT